MMEGFEYIQATRDYLDYLEEHLTNVRKAWCEIQDKCKDMRIIYDDYYYNWLASEVIGHDLSKFSKEEFTQYRDYFFMKEQEVPAAQFSNAWSHHLKHNKHHWENWTEKDEYHPNEWEVHCTHMVIDWMAMGYKFGDTAQSYYEKNKEKIKIPNYAEDYIYEIFKRLKT